MSGYLPPGQFDPTKYKYAIGYGRFSKPQRNSVGHSRERQEEALHAACARWNWQVLDQYFDPGVSGGRGRNRAIGALRELIERVKLKQIPSPSETVLVIEAFDRLTREALTKAQLQFLDLVDRGLGIFTTMDGIGYDAASINGNPGQLFTSIGMMLSASGVYQVMSDRSTKGWSRRRDKNTKICPAWLEMVDGEYVFKPNAKVIIGRIFEEARYYGSDKIAAHLNAEGVSPFTSPNHAKRRISPVDGKAIWYDSVIHRIVTGRLARGEIQEGKIVYENRTTAVRGEDVGYEVPVRKLTGEWKAKYPAAVEEDVWQAANAAMQARITGRGRKGVTFPNLFQGFCKCAKCGAAMTYKCTTIKGKSYERLSCINRRRKKCDARFTYDYHQVEHEFLMLFQDDVKAILDNVPENNAAFPIKLRIAELQADLLHMQARQASITESVKVAARTGDKSEAQITKLLAMFDLDGERETKVAEIAKLEKGLQQIEATQPRTERVQSMRQLVSDLEKMAPADKYAIRAKINTGLRGLIHRMEFNETGKVVVRLGEAVEGKTAIWMNFSPAVFLSYNHKDRCKWQYVVDACALIQVGKS